jgi:hypothetical protein
MTGAGWSSVGDVDGLRVMSPIQGFGKMWQKTYSTVIPRDVATPERVIATWRERFGEFWPEGNRFYAPLTGLAPGEVARIAMDMPGRVTLSTGVLVLYADDVSFTLMTPQGHMFAGWITFSAATVDEGTSVRAQVLMRASDPIYEAGLTFGGHRQEDRFWAHTLTRVAAHFGHDAVVTTDVVCVDRRRQWRRWHNVRHSAALRSRPHLRRAQ